MRFKFQRGWLWAVATWAYLIAAIILYVYFDVAWVNTFDVLFGTAALIVLSIWYVTDRIRYSDPSRRRTSSWAIGPYGMVYRRHPKQCPPENEPFPKPRFAGLRHTAGEQTGRSHAPCR